MDLDINFTQEKLQKIIDETGVGSCACPAEVCQSILAVRRLFETQSSCLAEAGAGPLRDSHAVIAYYSRLVHQQLEACLDQVIKIEGWNPVTLEMPSEIRKLRDLE